MAIKRSSKDEVVSTLVRGCGWKRDPVDDRDFKARALFGARRGIPNESMQLEACVPGIFNQESTSSCVGHAIGTAIDTRFRKLGRWDAPLTSKQAIYTIARAQGRLQKDEALVDEGCQPRLAMKGIRGDKGLGGVPDLTRWPFDPSKINDDLPLDVLMQANAHKVDAWWRIDSFGKERVEDICQALMSGYPVVFGTDVDTKFQNHTGKTPIGPHDPNNVVGGHMMCFVGYRTDGSQRVLRAVNSWGLGWGDSGMFWASEAFVMEAALGDLYVIQAS